MKTAYNKSWVKNLQIQQTAQLWVTNNLLTSSQFERIKAAFPESFYRPGIFVKIGLFLFTVFGGSFFAGFLSLFFIDNAGSKTFAVLSFISAACYYFFLEFFIKDRKLFHSGIDNALLYMGNGAIIITFVVLFEGMEIWQYCSLVLLVNGITTIRYADLFTVFISMASIFVGFASILVKFPIGKAFMPFATMILSVLLYVVNKSERDYYYRECQILIKIFVMVTFYFGGNYYVVREGNALLSEITTPNAPQIPFAILFYVFTTVIPILYCFLGLKNRDRVFLIVGLFTAAFSCFTYRYYFDFLAIEIILSIGGFLLILISVLSINYLKIPRFGVTDEIMEGRKLANLEAILIANQFGQTPEENNFKFGGGNFGGGGAGNDY
ncbi:hypothetical protein SAMN04487995_2918 [Dyadobacter koreensis]|uniref:DUF2157 domain-containing protein n=1 Tax=Dyadobacter koreensis TaxID=408657 RepID=A0A1H6V8K4_9BACT|nr:hypothetical protein [Dyadobacter koreensis]SEI99234.1 hypothetical protein SAMN04487995_2918 [Dyadobacter koreensis]